MTGLAAREMRPHSGAMDFGNLRALKLIESVGDSEPFSIVLITHSQGTAMTAEELMAAKVKWAERAGYRVLTNTVPASFTPFNAVIRVSETGTEDRNRDYLAHIM